MLPIVNLCVHAFKNHCPLRAGMHSARQGLLIGARLLATATLLTLTFVIEQA